MISIDRLKKVVEAQANKEALTNTPSPEQFTLFVNDAVREVYNYLYGLLSSYKSGAPVPEVASDKTRLVSELERYLETRERLAVSNGSVAVPDGDAVVNLDGVVCPPFRHLDRLLLNYYDDRQSPAAIVSRKVEILRGVEVEDRLTSVISPPSLEFPVGELHSSHYKLYWGSGSVLYVLMIYQRKPVPAKWAFTTDVTLPLNRRRPVYDPVESVDVDLPEEAFGMLKERVLHMMGVRERDAGLVQASMLRASQNE